MKIVVTEETGSREILGEYVRTDEDSVEYLEDETGALAWAPSDCVEIVDGRRPGGPGHRLTEVK